MFTLKRVAVAGAALALVALPALAGDYYSEGPRPTLAGSRSVRTSSTGRRVAVWRDLQPADNEEAEGDASNPFDAPDRGDSPQGDYAPAPRPDSLQQGSGCTDGDFLSESGGDCGNDGCCTPCNMMPFWTYRSHIFGEYLYLQASGVDMAHAIQQNGVGGLGTTPDGRVGVVDGVWTPAYRVGFAAALSGCTSIGASYTNFQSHSTDSLVAPDVLGGTVRSLVLHPESINAGSTSSFVDASYDIDFQTADAEYRSVILGGFRGQASFTLGARYAKLDQRFAQFGEFAPPIGSMRTTTDIRFEGGGVRTGLDGQRLLGPTQLAIYGKGFFNLIFGRFTSEYEQFDQTTSSIQAASNWQNDRVVPILEYEVGVTWTSRNGRWRTSTGYYTAFWFNSVTTSEFVQAVQTANFIDLGQTISFQGLVSRLEFRF